jgi:hypothetical protein
MGSDQILLDVSHPMLDGLDKATLCTSWELQELLLEASLESTAVPLPPFEFPFFASSHD